MQGGTGEYGADGRPDSNLGPHALGAVARLSLCVTLIAEEFLQDRHKPQLAVVKLHSCAVNAISDGMSFLCLLFLQQDFLVLASSPANRPSYNYADVSIKANERLLGLCAILSIVFKMGEMPQEISF